MHLHAELFIIPSTKSIYCAVQRTCSWNVPAYFKGCRLLRKKYCTGKLKCPKYGHNHLENYYFLFAENYCPSTVEEMK